MHKNSECVYFRCEASLDIGYGHMMRCLSLAGAFQRFGVRYPVFITANTDGDFANFIEQSGFTHVVLDKHIGEDDEISEVVGIIKKEKQRTVPICVVDSYDITGDYEKKLKKEGIFVVAIDDMSVRSFCSDIVINYHVRSNLLSCKHESYTRFLLGPAYAPLRSDFVETCSFRKKSSNAINNILVTLGGGSLANNIVCEIIIDSLCLLKNNIELKVVIVASLSEEAKKNVQKRARLSGLKLTILSNVTNMAELMLESDLAIAAGGITAYELAACGLPSLLFILGDNQADIVRSFSYEGLCVDLGWFETVSPKKLAETISELRNSPAKCEEMSLNGRRLVDGKGCRRIVEEITKYC